MEYKNGRGQFLSLSPKWRNIILLALLASMGLFKTPHLDAVIYQWIDENGVKHFSNSPPDNVGDFNKIFDAYKYDKAADLERIKFDQMQIDALDEQLEEELKVIEEESKKVIESKQSDSPWPVGRCFSPSFSVQRGIGVFENIVPRVLSEGEYYEILELLSGLKGTWSGNAEIITCDLYEGKVFQKLENFTIRSECEINSPGAFFLESNLYSRENRVNSNQSIHMYLTKEHLTTRTGVQRADISVLSVSTDELVVFRKSTPKTGGLYSGHRIAIETVWTFKKQGETSFSLQTFKSLLSG